MVVSMFTTMHSPQPWLSLCRHSRPSFCRAAAPGVSPQLDSRAGGQRCGQACLPPGASSTSGNPAGMQQTQPLLLLPLPKALIFPKHRFSSWCGETWRGTGGQYRGCCALGSPLCPVVWGHYRLSNLLSVAVGILGCR